MIKYRQFTKGQKIFVIMGIFVCGLLFYANGVAFNLISAPTYVGDIITFSALAVAVALTVITLTIVIRDKRRSLFAITQKSNVANSSKESIETPSTILLPVDSQENADKVDLISTVRLILLPLRLPKCQIKRQFQLPGQLKFLENETFSS